MNTRTQALLPALALSMALSFAAGPGMATQAKPVPHKVYRCASASPAGHATYSQRPCDEKASAIQVDDARTTAQIKHSRDMAERDQALANRMKREREHEARLAADQGAISLSAVNDKPHRVRAETSDDRAGKGISGRAEKPKRQRHFRARAPKQVKTS